METMSTSTESASAHLASRTTLRVWLDGERVRIHLAVDAPEGRPGVRPMLLGCDASTARVALVPEGALLLADDRVRIDVEVGAGACLELVEPGGTVAYDMEGGSAHWDVVATVGPSARLLWHGETFVVSAGAQVARTTRLVVADGAQVALREVLVLGRHGERAGALDQQTTCTDGSGAPLLVERLEVDAARLGMLLGGQHVMASVTTFGLPALDAAASTQRYDLECGGHLYRACADSAHAAAGPDLWDQVARAIRSRTANSMPTASAR